MSTLRFTIFIFFLLLATQRVRSQSVTQPIEWFGTTSNMKASQSVTLLFEGLYRFAKDFQPMQLQFRIGADFRVSDKFSIMPVAYAFTINPIYGDQPATYVNNEHRIFQQFSYKHKEGRINFQQRIRTEQRFLQKHETVNGSVIDDGYVNNQFRVRYRFFFTVPIASEKIEHLSGYH